MKKPLYPKKWLNKPARYSKNTLSIDGFQVMQRWEEPYMADLASITSENGGTVLEIGFGMGLSTSYIQKEREVKKHIVIDCHPEVVKYALTKFKRQIESGRLIIISGSWEDILPTFKDNSFDGILFDSFEPYVGQLSDFYGEARRLLKKGGHFTYFSSEAKKFSKNRLEELKKTGFKKINYRLCQVKPPKYCLYWKQKIIISPIITK